MTRRPGEQLREAARYLERTGWNIEVHGDPGLLGAGERPRITFPPLAEAGSLGSLNAEPDPDGVYRRMPLLVRYGESFYPSIAFRAACDYLGVSPDRIVVRPGKTITLRGARRPGGTPRDIVIPVDRRGNLVINFVGDWAGGIATHYDFADILNASDRRADMPLWTDLLGGKIAVVSDVSTGSTDTGAVPTDKFFLLSGLHANVIHSLLTESFLYEPVAWQMRLIEIALLAAVLFLSIRCSALTFSLGTLGLGIGYGALAAAAFLFGALILPFVRPLLMVTLALLSVGAYRYHVEETTRLILRSSFESYFPPPSWGRSSTIQRSSIPADRRRSSPSCSVTSRASPPTAPA